MSCCAKSGGNASGIRRTVDMHVASLRRKVEANPSLPEHIPTVKGIGYKFNGHV
jgi:two-component system response regulator RegX3